MAIQGTAPTISEARAREILTPHLELLGHAVEAAWRRWLETPPGHLKALVSRTRANIVYDFICDEIRARFGAVQDASVTTTRYGVLLLNIRGLVLIRFKKLNNERLGSNISTKYQTEFNLQLRLPDIPDEAARLVVGYQLDKACISIADIFVTYRVQDEVKWSFSLRENAATQVSPVMLPFPTAIPVHHTKKRVTSKKQRLTGDSKKLQEQIAESIEPSAEEQRKTSDQ